MKDLGLLKWCVESSPANALSLAMVFWCVLDCFWLCVCMAILWCVLVAVTRLVTGTPQSSLKEQDDLIGLILSKVAESHATGVGVEAAFSFVDYLLTNHWRDPSASELKGYERRAGRSPPGWLPSSTCGRCPSLWRRRASPWPVVGACEWVFPRVMVFVCGGPGCVRPLASSSSS